jgi:predicted metal-dependent hydrolase
VASATEQISVNGVHAPIEVRRHPNARRMTLRVSRTRHAVIVTLPTQCDIGQAGNFLTSNLAWVQKHLGTLPQPVRIDHGVIIPLRGDPHRVVFCDKAERGSGVVNREHGEDGIQRLIVNGAPDSAAKRLLRWLADQARTDLDKSVNCHARRLNLRPKKITVRDQTTRWGSCSTTGALSFSWRLILAPEFVLDYVAAHEVAHLAEMNHGPKFWALVRKTNPRCDEAKTWLSVFGMDLHRYSA